MTVLFKKCDKIYMGIDKNTYFCAVKPSTLFYLAL